MQNICRKLYLYFNVIQIILAAIVVDRHTPWGSAMDIYKCAASAQKKLFINPATENFFPKNCYSYHFHRPQWYRIKLWAKNNDSNFFDSLNLTRMIKLYTPVDHLFLLGSVRSVQCESSKIQNSSTHWYWFRKEDQEVERYSFFGTKFFVCWIHNVTIFTSKSRCSQLTIYPYAVCKNGQI